MKFDYNQIEAKVLPNFKNGEKELRVKMYDDELNKIMRGTLIPGASIGLHTHENNSEIIYIISGHGVAIIDGKQEEVGPNICHYCKKGSSHTLINNSNETLEFFAVVSNQ